MQVQFDATKAFELERAAIVGEMAQGLEDVAASMVILNDNMESLLAVGKSFQTISQVWSDFHSIVTEPGQESKICKPA
eukprot:CFRG3093T1